MPKQRSNSYLILGIEGTRGTLSTNLLNAPCTGPQLSPMQKWLQDNGYRNSPVKTYDNIPGVTNAEYEVKLNVFADTTPIFVRAALGGTDTKTAAITATTLAASATAGASTISSTASIPVGSAIVIDTVGGLLMETHLTTAVTGAGPYTVTLGSPLMNNHANGAAVAGLTAHQFQLEPFDSTGSQPPSVSIQDFDGSNAYQILAAQLSDLTISHGAEKALELSAKFVGNPYSAIGNPSLTVGTEHFIPAWAAEHCIGGTQLVTVLEGEYSIKRDSTASIWTENFAGGVATPHANFAGDAEVTGKRSFVVETGDSTLTYGLTYDKLVMVSEWTDPQTGHLVHIQTSRTQFKDPKRTRGKIYTQVDSNFEAEGNTTDASSGYSPILITVANAVTTQY